MKRQLLTVTLVAALAAVPVRADDGLFYLAGRPAADQIGSEQLRDRLKQYLSRPTVTAPIRTAEPRQEVAALTIAEPTIDPAPDAVPMPQRTPLVEVPSNILVVPEEVLLPAGIEVAALPADPYGMPVPMRIDDAVEEQSLDLDFSLPVAEATVDGTQLAHFAERGRAVVFSDQEDALASLGLEAPRNKVPAESLVPLQSPTAHADLLNANAAAQSTQVASADPIPLVLPQYRSADDDASAASQAPTLASGADPASAPPRPMPKPDYAGTQVAALAPQAAVSTQAISIDGRGAPLTIQTGKGRMLRLPEAVDAVFVAQPDIADIQLKSPRLLYLFGKQPGETTIYATARDETVVLNQRIQVAHNLDPLNELIRAVHPEAIVEVKSLNNTIVLTGLVPDVATAENIFQLAGQVMGETGQVMNRIKVAGVNQVNLRVRIAEVNRQISKELGFNWDVLRETGSLAIGFATLGVGSISSATSNVAAAALSSGNWDVNSIIDALDDEGLVTVLAEPNLTAMNGEVANFLAGGEFPIPIAQGDDTISITFKQFGVSLSFSPQILEKGRINVKVLTEVSQLSEAGAVSFSGFSVPALTTRRAETTVELRSGQSFAIAGLLQNVTNQSVEEFPGLADLPILGPLFKSESFQKDETELLVVVTPYLVRPTNAQIALPMDGFVPPTDADRLMRQSNRPRVPDNNAAPADRGGRPGSVGDAGFIVR